MLRQDRGSPEAEPQIGKLGRDFPRSRKATQMNLIAHLVAAGLLLSCPPWRKRRNKGLTVV